MAEKAILIVENSDKIVGKISPPLEKAGFSVRVVRWAEEGLSVIQENDIDIVLVHDKQAGMNGAQFTISLRQNERFLLRPIVFVYGKDDIETKIRSFKAGADDYLVLPFSIPELLARIDVRLRKTASDITQIDDTDLAPQYKELDLLPSFKKEGSLVSTSLPRVFAAITLNGFTGILRLIQGRTVRSFFFENGYVRAGGSSHRRENLSRHLIKWKAVSEESKKRFVNLTRTGSDKTVSETLARLTGADRNILAGLAIRHALTICRKAIKMNKAEYDWEEIDKPSDMFVADYKGVHPFHFLMSVYRSMYFPPDYSVFYPKPTQWIFPSMRFGRLRDKFMFTPTEEIVLAMTENGIPFNRLIRYGNQVLRYGGAFIHTALCFFLLFPGEKRPVSKSEAKAVSLDPVVREIEAAYDQLVEPITSDSLEVAPEDMFEKLSEKTIEKPEEKSVGKPIEKTIGELAGKTIEKPVSSSRSLSDEKHVPASQTPGSPPEKVRKVRELYPVKPSEAKIVKGPAGPEYFGFKSKHLFEGDVSRVPVPFLFALAMSPEINGTLAVRINEFETKLFWKRGHLVFARSDDPDLRIDQIMVDMKMISPEQKSKVDKMIQEIGKMRSGTLIFKNQMVNMLQLSEAIQKQMFMILDRLFNASTGTYRFREGELPPDEHIPLDIGTKKVFMDHLVSLKNTESIDPFLPERDSLFVHTDEARSKITGYYLGGRVMSIFDKFRKPVTVNEGIVGLDISLKQMKIIVMGLVLLRLLCSAKQGKNTK